MKKILLLLSFLVLVSCSDHKVMSSNGYSEVQVGMNVKDLVKVYGKPYQIHSKGYKSEVYEYIERIIMGNQVIEQKRYYFVVDDDMIVGKYLKVNNPPPFEAIYSDDPYPNY